MTACPHCKASLPADFVGAECPACHRALRRSSGPVTPLGGVPVAPATLRPRPEGAASTTALLADDKWDLPAEPAPSLPDPAPALPYAQSPSATPDAQGATPSSFGRPAGSTRPSARPGMSTMIMAAPVIVPAPPPAVPEPRAPTPTRPLGALSTDAAARALLPRPPPADPLRSTADLGAGDAAQPTLAPEVPERTASSAHARAPSSAGVPSVASGTGLDAPERTESRRTPSATLALGPAQARTISGAVPAATRGVKAFGTLIGNVAPVPPPMAASRLVAVPDGDAPEASHAPRRLELAVEPAPDAAAAPSDVHPIVAPPPPPPTPPRAATAPARADTTGTRAATDATASHGAASATQKHRLVLASEVLREDLVPHEPDGDAMRWVLGVAGAVLLATAVIELVRGPHALSAWAIPGMTAAIVAAVPMRYATRALLGFAPALPAFAVQALALPGATTTGALLFTAVAAVLPAALLFRANFRASRRARVFVAAGLVLGLGWLVVPGGGSLFGRAATTSWATAHVPAIGLLVVLLASLLAFMGANTTGGCRAWSALSVAWTALVVLAAGAVRGGDFEPGVWSLVAAASVASLAAAMAVSVAGLLAVYARPSEPRTGIGLAATHHPPAPRTPSATPH